MSASILTKQKSKAISQMELGKNLYQKHCSLCHLKNGKGSPGIYPPLDASDYMLSDVNRTIKTILYGSKTGIIVNGIKYPGSVMTPFNYMPDRDIAAITNYILNSWSNTGDIVSEEEVKSNR